MLSAVLAPKLAPHNQNSVKLTVDFDSAWDGYGKSAIFHTKNNPTPYEKVLDAADSCFVPAEVLAEPGYMFITIKGVKTIDNSVKASARLKLKVSDGAPLFVVAEPSEDVYKQLLAAYGSTNKKLSTALDETNRKLISELNDIYEALAVERARINNFVALDEGSTTGDAELIDMRTDGDGKTHDAAGEAVRSQTKRIADTTSELLEINYLAQLNDNSTMEKGFIVRKTGEVQDHDTYYHTDYIRVFKGIRYVTTAVDTHFSFYDLDKKKIEDGEENMFVTYNGLENFRAFSGNYYRPNFIAPCDGYVRLSSTESNLIIVALKSDTDSTLVLTREDAVNKPFIPYGKSKTDKDMEDVRHKAERTEDIVNASLYRLNLADRSKFVEGKYYAYGDSYESVTVGENSLYFHTDYIPVTAGQQIFATFRFMVCFDENKNAIYSESQGLPQTDYVYTVGENVAYIIFTGYTDSIDEYMVHIGDTKMDYVPYEKIMINESIINEHLSDKLAVSLARSGGNSLKASVDGLENGAVIALDDFPKNLKKGVAMTFYATFDDFVSVTIGKGYNGYRGDALKITRDSVMWAHYNDSSEAEKRGAATHGLTINTFLAVAYRIDDNGVCHYTISTLSNSFSGSFDWSYEQNGAPFVIGEQDMSNVELGAVAADIRSPMWLFGDSYFGVSSDRVMGQLKNFGYMDGCLVCGLAGLGSSGGYDNLENLMSLGGVPKYLVWCEGMNDNVSNYQTYLDKIIDLQKKYGFELILYRVPTVPTKADINNGINAIVEASGYRYIDAKKAVGADDSGNWYTDYLSSDGIHPTAFGAMAIAARFLIDVPEIMQYGDKRG